MKEDKKFFCGKWRSRIIVISIAIVLVSIPFIIMWAYLKGTADGLPNTCFTASDLLSFYGSVLAFLGTISLGALALRQNDIFKKDNEKLKRIELAQYTSIPRIIGNITLEEVSTRIKSSDLSIRYDTPNSIYRKNISKICKCTFENPSYPIIKASVSQFFYGKHEKRFVEKGIGDEKDIYIATNEQYELQIICVPIWSSYLSDFTDANPMITKLSLKLENIFGFITECEIMLNKDNINTFKIVDLKLKQEEKENGIQESATGDK